jgi:hypothetical protein
MIIFCFGKLKVTALVFWTWHVRSRRFMTQMPQNRMDLAPEGHAGSRVALGYLVESMTCIHIAI